MLRNNFKNRRPENGNVILLALIGVTLLSPTVVPVLYFSRMLDHNEVARLNAQEGFFASEIAAWISSSIQNGSGYLAYANDYLSETSWLNNDPAPPYFAGQPLNVKTTAPFDRDGSAQAVSNIRRMNGMRYLSMTKGYCGDFTVPSSVAIAAHRIKTCLAPPPTPDPLIVCLGDAALKPMLSTLEANAVQYISTEADLLNTNGVSGKIFRLKNSIALDSTFWTTVATTPITLKNSILDGNGFSITSAGNAPITGNVGGVLGFVNQAIVHDLNVSFPSLNAPQGASVGGLAANATDGCFVNVSVRITALTGPAITSLNTGFAVGGIVGTMLFGVIANSSFVGTVGGPTSYVGGLSGRGTGSSASPLVITNSFVKGIVSNPTVNGVGTAGGLIGGAGNRTCSPGSYWPAGHPSAYTMISNSYFKGDVTGKNAAGGLVGMLDATSHIQNSYVIGGCSGIQSVNTSGAMCGVSSSAGGLIGFLSDPTGVVVPSVATDSYAATPVSSSMGVAGGLVGSGSVSTDNTTYPDISYAKLTDSYYDNSLAPISTWVGPNTSGPGGQSYTDSQMQVVSNFPWDFKNIWTSATLSPPVLQWQNSYPPVLPARSLGSGDLHSCLVDQICEAFCWGYDLQGEIGDNKASNSDVPVAVAGRNSNVSEIGGGTYYSCAVESGGVFCWGDNTFGQLGNGTNVPSLIPVTVSGLSNVTAIAVGPFHACALANGGVSCWGQNSSGELGNGSTVDSNVPVPVTSLGSGVTVISVGMSHSCGLQGGQIVCWGDNTFGQLGNNSFANSLTPVAVSGSSGATALVSGNFFNCLIHSGAVQCWGINDYGELGNGSSTNALAKIPGPVTGMGSSATQLFAYKENVCAVKSGNLWCWGANDFNQFGTNSPTAPLTPNTTPGSSTPVQMSGLSGIGGLAIGRQMMSVILAGHADTWGDNTYGELGNNSFVSSTSPVQVTGF